ncbi:uncharacterized protein LOC125609072 isoform X1 [Brassica napus]|uniref:uncharacterized protein LOC125609072 isoform X1 n=1 Tax=Brassica napus TaxID=3708 RepID=UPI002078AB72|nr:uncharacterized protein LOC125609072 isoform X1 [Brassica napus]
MKSVSTINWAICKAIDLLEMLKREEEMLSAIKEKQLKGLLMIAHRKLNLAHIFFECSTWMTNVFLQDVIKEINKDNLKICLLTCIFTDVCLFELLWLPKMQDGCLSMENMLR